MNIKTLSTIACMTGLMTLASCADNNKQNTTVGSDGHLLWFNSLQMEAPAQFGATTMQIAEENISKYWKSSSKVALTLNATANDELGKEGFELNFADGNITASANTEIGLLYASYELLRMQESGNEPKNGEKIVSVPAFERRILNHWDNLDGTVERGYAGHSIWIWETINTANIAANNSIYAEYARANASVGINGTVLNNVNANADILTREYLLKVKTLADIFRPYGLKVYLSLNFAAPKHLAGLETSDPLDKEVVAWWNAKVDEIYNLIPDFGGFLVKANSEGQSGPQDYGRTHADGANMIADALKPHGGIVMWRAFVYDAKSPDRAKQAVEEFMPLDGQFRDNVLIQIKNGPVDFQPREPFSPLFGQFEKTQAMVEVQITQEYLGHANHLVFLHPMWKECLDSDTYERGEGSTVGAITEGKIIPYKYTAIAGVSNVGNDRNWCGHHFAQANWYAFGRMAWNPELTSEQIADEWLRQTFTTDNQFVEPIRKMMLASHEACVNYEMPLGLHHTFKGPDHYGPGPWDRSIRPDWEPAYYHKAAADGLGFDRTMNGSGAVAQYHEPLKSMYNDVTTCPENLILWFHHLPWDYKMKSGHTLWDELCLTFQSGMDDTKSFVTTWNSVEQYVDAMRFADVKAKLERQAKDAIWWRDATIQYFQQFSGKELPDGCQPFQQKLDNLMKYRIGITNYENPKIETLPEYKLDNAQ
ncbi:MAG: alpha-glucuronidase [Salinivirgaceae bacterium]|nr:alpha-glucuronidase [Salinivirgaceae bacterium]